MAGRGMTDAAAGTTPKDREMKRATATNKELVALVMVGAETMAVHACLFEAAARKIRADLPGSKMSLGKVEQ